MPSPTGPASAQSDGFGGSGSARVRADGPGRNMSLDQLAKVLQDQSTRAFDVIAGAGAIRSIAGRLVVDSLEPHLGPDGVTMTSGTYALNDVAVSGIADKLGIPVGYLRKLATEHVDLFDDNVNGWLRRCDRRFLVRVLRTDPTAPAIQAAAAQAVAGDADGVVRAFLSDRYSRIDNLDVLLAALEGIKTSGAEVQVDGADLTDRRMYLRVSAPQVRAMAPTLLRNYRSPFDSRPGSDLPVVWAGFMISNSETGCGAFTIAPRLMVQVCRNGMGLEHEAMRRTHLGARNTGEDGVVQWSAETMTKVLELITSRTRDAVAAYLDTDYVARMVRQLEQVSGTPVHDPDTTIKVVSQRLKFTDEQRQSILNHFIHGADLSAGGVMHAVTSVAQTLDDADAAHDLESAAVQAMHLAASA